VAYGCHTNILALTRIVGHYLVRSPEITATPKFRSSRLFSAHAVAQGRAFAEILARSYFGVADLVVN
jgi:hypothetical protein